MSLPQPSDLKKLKDSGLALIIAGFMNTMWMTITQVIPATNPNRATFKKLPIPILQLASFAIRVSLGTLTGTV